MFGSLISMIGMESVIFRSMNYFDYIGEDRT